MRAMDGRLRWRAALALLLVSSSGAPSTAAGPAAGTGSRLRGTSTTGAVRVPLLIRSGPTAPPAPSDVTEGSPFEIATYGRWKGLTKGCSYLAPRTPFVTNDGGVRVVFHFHAGEMSESQLKEGAPGTVFVACGFGVGTAPYAEAFASPERFGQLERLLIRNLEADAGRKGLALKHLALVSWSAGFAAIARILSVPRYYAATDSVILLDSLHARYTGPGKHGASEGADHVDTAAIGIFVRFAHDAVSGAKSMVITHSSVIPPDYASSTEATTALLREVNVPQVAETTGDARVAALVVRADRGGLHVRGYGGARPRDHIGHLYLVGEALRTWVVPRWNREDQLVYTLAREQR